MSETHETICRIKALETRIEEVKRIVVREQQAKQDREQAELKNQRNS